MNLLLRIIENFVLFSTMFATIAFAIAVLGRTLVRHGVVQPRPDSLARFYSRTLIAPPVAALWLVIAAFVPEWKFNPTNFNIDHGAPFHKLHLWSELTAGLEPGLAYATVLFLLAAAAFLILSSWRAHRRITRVIASLELIGDPPPAASISAVQECASRYSLDVGLVTSSYAFSFVWGFSRSKLIISTALLSALSAGELRGVIEHEAAHHRRRDNSAKLILSLCSCSSLLFPLSRLILKWRALAVEMVCDELAAVKTQRPLEVANALVKLRRHKSADHLSSVPTISGFVSRNENDFERRVLGLIALGDHDGPITESPVLARFKRIQLAIGVATFLVTLTAFTHFSPFAVHHSAESLIRIFKKDSFNELVHFRQA